MKRLCLLTMLALYINPAFAKGNIEAGKQKSVPCQACHGGDGNAAASGQYPRLAGQYADYLAKAMNDYKTGERKNVIMQGFSTPLSNQDIEDIAAYFANLPSKLDDLSHYVQ